MAGDNTEKMRATLKKFVGAKIKVTAVPADVGETGDIIIKVPLAEAGLKTDDLRIGAASLIYAADVMGEWLVRCNIDVFKALMNDPRVAASSKLFMHRHFGLKATSVDILFSMHMSMIAKILADEASAAARKTAEAGKIKQPGKVVVTSAEQEAFREWLRNIPVYTTGEMMKMLGDAGYVGQDEARKAVCLMAYRHLNRIRRIHLDGVERAKLPPKDNMILIGPTGCGKTFLVEQLFKNILKIPTVIIDITSYTEVGYVGDEISTLLTRLIQAADNDLLRASVGIVCIDEFDKIGALAGAPGTRTNNDVSGAGVQRELLKMFDGAECMTATEVVKMNQSKVPFETSNIPFICCGAFSGLKMLSKDKRRGSIGFNGKIVTKETVQDGFTDEEVTTSLLATFGIMPELTGRINRIVTFKGVDKAMLRTILEKNLLSQYRNELKLNGVELNVDEKVYDLIIDECMKKGTGARSLRGSILRHMEEACFCVYSEKEPKGRIDIVLEDGSIHCTIAA